MNTGIMLNVDIKVQTANPISGCVTALGCRCPWSVSSPGLDNIFTAHRELRMVLDNHRNRDGQVSGLSQSVCISLMRGIVNCG